MERPNKAYVDISGWNGVVEFADDSGQLWKIEKRDGDSGYHFYRKDGTSWWFDGWCATRKRTLPKTPSGIRRALNEYLGEAY